MIETRIELIDEILEKYESALLNDFQGYRNHVYRMVNFCFAQQAMEDDDRDKLILAGCFHDLGIWTGKTFDYLDPSIELAKIYLEAAGLSSWRSEIEAMIGEHHKLRRYSGPGKLVEVFRRADLADLTLGWARCGIAGEYVRKVRNAFPNAGFHRTLFAVAGKWICRHPLDPVPVVRW
jgi:hypothetical protein